jgi:radical SAM-linked protein
MQANYVQRIRLTIGKSGSARFIGHLDLARTMERAINRARIPVAYTQGFNKRPRMQFADALPLGFTSECEMVDLWLGQVVGVQETEDRLESVLPDGIDLYSVSEVDISETPLQNQTESATYRVRPGEDLSREGLQGRISELLQLPELQRERRDKVYDLRPRIHSLSLSQNADERLEIMMELSLEPGEIGRPDEVLLALELDPLSAEIHRTHLILATDGKS